jgi:hypothetical protein
MMAHTCNPSYLQGRDQKDSGLRPAQGKSWQDPITTNKPSMVACACGEPQVEDHCLRLALGKNLRPYLKISRAKRDWGCGSSGRVLA